MQATSDQFGWCRMRSIDPGTTPLLQRVLLWSSGDLRWHHLTSFDIQFMWFMFYDVLWYSFFRTFQDVSGLFPDHVCLRPSWTFMNVYVLLNSTVPYCTSFTSLWGASFKEHANCWRGQCPCGTSSPRTFKTLGIVQKWSEMYNED